MRSEDFVADRAWLYRRDRRGRSLESYRATILTVFFGLWCIGSLLTLPVLDPAHRWWWTLPILWSALGAAASFRGVSIDFWCAAAIASLVVVFTMLYALTGQPSPYVLALAPVAAFITLAPVGVAFFK